MEIGGRCLLSVRSLSQFMLSISLALSGPKLLLLTSWLKLATSVFAQFWHTSVYLYVYLLPRLRYLALITLEVGSFEPFGSGYRPMLATWI